MLERDDVVSFDWDSEARTCVITMITPERATYEQSQSELHDLELEIMQKYGTHEGRRKYKASKSLGYPGHLASQLLWASNACAVQMESASLTQTYSAILASIFVTDYDPRTGAKRTRCLASLVTTGPAILSVDLENVEPLSCFKHLGGSIVSDFSSGSLVPGNTPHGSLDDLYELTPREFEDFVHDLLTALGFESAQTQQSWDRGIDCIAVDARPIVGGKVIVQAKRYKGTVEASAVRDLFGTVHAQGASKGVLITTGTFGPTSYEFAAGKPLELIDGKSLKALWDKVRAL
jgi:hypothetical protein